MTRLGPKWSGSAGGAAMTAFAAALLLWAAATQPRSAAPPASMNGRYEVRVAGYGTGEGTCQVSGKGVDVDCRVEDDGGNEQQLAASDLRLDGYRFRGRGTLGGVPVQVAGRIEPADAAGRKPRVSATFLATDGRAGRMVGTHE